MRRNDAHWRARVPRGVSPQISQRREGATAGSADEGFFGLARSRMYACKDEAARVSACFPPAPPQGRS